MSPSPPLVVDEVAEQPGVLERLLGRRHEVAAALRGVEAPLGLLLIARGSSDNAATYGRYVLEAASGRPATLAANSLLLRYRRVPRLDGWLAVGISQSGETPEVVEGLVAAGQAGATPVAVTNGASSELARIAKAAVLLDAGTERAVPSTKTYTATLMALALIAEAVGQPPWPPSALAGVPEAVQRAVSEPGPVAALASALGDADQVTFLARGYLFAAALESALKVREMSRRPAEGWSVADYLHGPIAAASGRTVAVCHAEPGPVMGDATELVALLRTRGVTTACISSAPDAVAADLSLPVPALPEPLAAMVHAVRSQQLAIEVAGQLGLNPDQPEGLTKVTPTA